MALVLVLVLVLVVALVLALAQVLVLAPAQVLYCTGLEYSACKLLAAALTVALAVALMVALTVALTVSLAVALAAASDAHHCSKRMSPWNHHSKLTASCASSPCREPQETDNQAPPCDASSTAGPLYQLVPHLCSESCVQWNLC